MKVVTFLPDSILGSALRFRALYVRGAKNPKETGGSGLLQLGRAHILKNRVCPTGENCSAVGCERGLRIDP